MVLKMKSNVVVDKTFDFAVRIVKLNKYLSKNKNEYVISKQLLRSGTSIGANVNEAQAAQSKADFIAKMSIASKEARETNYWINLLIKTNFLNLNDIYTKSLINEIEEIMKLLTSIVKSAQENKNAK
jgi:four helix bundle protein